MIRKFLQTCCFFLAILSGSWSAAQTKPLVQSTFYDAVSLYFAYHGINAYPVMTDDGSTAAFGGGNPGPKKFKIIESSTGKILLTDIPEDSLLKKLKGFTFLPLSDRKQLIDTIKARNAGIPLIQHLIDSAYNGNTYFTLAAKDTLIDSLVAFGYSDLTGFPLVGGSLPTVSTLAQGLAEFYLERLNEELNDAFFIHLKNALEKYEELKILFPKTVESLNKIEITRYETSLGAIKSSYKEDMGNLIENIPNLLTLDKYRNRILPRHPELSVLFAGCDLINLINKEVTAPEILHVIGDAPYCAVASNFTSGLRFAAVLSNSLRDIHLGDANPEQAGWLDTKKLSLFIQNPDIFRFYMGLLAQRVSGISFHFSNGGSFNLRDAILINRGDIIKGQFIAYNFGGAAAKIETVIDKIREHQKDSKRKSDYINSYLEIVNELLNLTETGLNLFPSESVTVVRVEVQQMHHVILPELQSANNILSNLEDGQYTLAVYGVSDLLKRVILPDPAITADEAKKKEAKKVQEILELFSHYGIFIASVASATTATDVKEAIKAFALPKGSSRIKKEHNFSVGLNGYVGLFHSWNRSYSDLPIPKEENGITAPLGVGINFGIARTMSLSLYGGIFDIGAIFGYKFNHDSTAIESAIKLGQIFSPSVGFVLGLPIIRKYNLPLSIGINHQWGPQLRKVEEKTNTVLPHLARRTNIFLAVDIPIVNFHVSRR